MDTEEVQVKCAVEWVGISVEVHDYIIEKSIKNKITEKMSMESASRHSLLSNFHLKDQNRTSLLIEFSN